MNYIYNILYVYTVTTYRKESYKHLHRHTPFFHNFNIGYSIFYTPLKYTFLQNNVLPSFYCVSVHLHIIYYNIRS